MLSLLFWQDYMSLAFISYHGVRLGLPEGILWQFCVLDPCYLGGL